MLLPHTSVYAQDVGAMSFTIAPPLFQLNLQPGESWSSTLTVVNSNPYDMTIYAEPVTFEPTGEGGRPNFVRAESKDGMVSAYDPTTLASWITVPTEGQVIAREQTMVLPFTIRVPADAAPGGQYAAILIGNKPPEGAVREGGVVSVTSAIASLVILRVAGDVVEKGRIRDYVTERSVYERAEARLSFRFENQGNVHLRPQGGITIYNMFNKKRGEIAVNQTNGYGNVLPGSIRKFAYSWESDAGWWDIGRYRAELTLGYGFESKQFTQARTYFWVLPVIPLAEVLGGIIATLWFFSWAIRRYIRRALALEGVQSRQEVQGAIPHASVHASTPVDPLYARSVAVGSAPTLKVQTLIRPIQAGMVDLRRVGTTGSKMISGTTAVSAQAPVVMQSEPFRFATFLHLYRYFFIFVGVVAVCWIAASAYFADVLTSERTFRAVEERVDDVVDEASTTPHAP